MVIGAVRSKLCEPSLTAGGRATAKLTSGCRHKYGIVELAELCGIVDAVSRDERRRALCGDPEPKN